MLKFFQGTTYLTLLYTNSISLVNIKLLAVVLVQLGQAILHMYINFPNHVFGEGIVLRLRLSNSEIIGNLIFLLSILKDGQGCPFHKSLV